MSILSGSIASGTVTAKVTIAEGIAALTKVFGNYLSGQSSSLTVKGVSGSGPQDWPVTNANLMSTLALVLDPYLNISLYQTVVTEVNDVYNTREIRYFEDNVPLALLVNGTKFDTYNYSFYSEYVCQCGFDNPADQADFTKKKKKNHIRGWSTNYSTSQTNTTTTAPSTSVTVTSLITYYIRMEIY
ncbi:hypothetical protein K501DRAFT_280279 [Backusella circina FSU 941]|nr:hypothetical protein K501DRAFT_280279 [Backusella circina FSU 941]